VFIKLLDFGYKEFITLEDVKSGKVNRKEFRLSGWEISGNKALDYFYGGCFLDLYLNLHKYIEFAVNWPNEGIEYSLEYPLLMYPRGSYSTINSDNQITFYPVESIPFDKYTKEQKERTDKTGFVFFRKIEDEDTLIMDSSEFLLQYCAPVPELTTMLHFLVEGKIVEFQHSSETDKELRRLWRHLEDTGVI